MDSFLSRGIGTSALVCAPSARWIDSRRRTPPSLKHLRFYNPRNAISRNQKCSYQGSPKYCDERTIRCRGWTPPDCIAQEEVNAPPRPRFTISWRRWQSRNIISIAIRRPIRHSYATFWKTQNESFEASDDWLEIWRLVWRHHCPSFPPSTRPWVSNFLLPFTNILKWNKGGHGIFWSRPSICVVHGLNGNAFDTWATGDVMWPRDLLPKTEPFDNARIMTFGYNSVWNDSQSLAGSREWSKYLLSDIRDVRCTDVVCAGTTWRNWKGNTWILLTNLFIGDQAAHYFYISFPWWACSAWRKYYTFSLGCLVHLTPWITGHDSTRQLRLPLSTDSIETLRLDFS